jgi:hypothetical protein
MRKPVIAAIAVSVLALVLSLLFLSSGTPNSAEDVGNAGDDALVELNRRVSALEERLNALDPAQPDPAGPVEKTGPAQPDATLTGEQVTEMVDTRICDALLRTMGRMRLTPDMLPENVREAATGLIPGSPIVSVELRSGGDQREYRFKTRFDGEDYDIRILGDAQVLRAEVPAVHAPGVVNDAVAKAVPGIDFYWMTLRMAGDDGQLVYDVEGKVKRRKYRVLVTPDGHVVGINGPDGKTRFERPPPRQPEAVQPVF